MTFDMSHYLSSHDAVQCVSEEDRKLHVLRYHIADFEPLTVD